jgi:hypothetical protein
MKNKGYILVGIIIFLVVVLMLINKPQQDQATYEEETLLTDTTSTEDVALNPPTSTLEEGEIGIFGYAEDDTDCLTPIAVAPTILDTRYSIDEINHVTSMLRAYYPQGYLYPFATGAQLMNLRIVDEVATVQMNQAFATGEGICSQSSREELVRQTLLQFPSIKEVLIQIQ